MKDKNIKQSPRFCKYIKCRKLLPKDASTLKKYCKDTTCAYKMNQLEATERRAEDKINNPKPNKFKVCNFDECKKTFEVPPKSPLQAYCSEECRTAKRKRDQNERNAIIAKAAADKKEEIAKKDESRTKKSGLSQRLLERGNISCWNIGWAGSMNA